MEQNESRQFSPRPPLPLPRSNGEIFLIDAFILKGFTFVTYIDKRLKKKEKITANGCKSPMGEKVQKRE